MLLLLLFTYILLGRGDNINQTLSIASIVFFSTLVLGLLCKYFKFCTKDNIPLQNLIIGLVSGFICYFTGVEANLLSAIVLCVLAAFSAGGVADLKKSVRKNKKDN